MAPDGRRAETDDAAAAPESVAVLRDGAGRLLARWLCTPDRLEDLATGWLVAEGHAAGLREVGPLRTVDERTVEAAISPAVADRILAARRTAGPAPDLADVRPAGPGAPPRSRPGPALRRLLAEEGALARLFAEGLERGTRRAEGGGIHTGIRVETEVGEEDHGAAIVDVVEDVSRAAVTDKLVGAALRGGGRLDLSVFLLTGRISAPIAAKLVRSGVAAAATLSVPTVLAVEIAAGAGVVLVGRARRGTPLRYGWPS
ncbi:MAG: formate dehydrogenase accessory sulfurtransferase FdhD [Gemmatimonadota bacterium]|nr:formate dehydrogenase accessory sulfurtransferase FdhD [Gemmatimonadota bacterium]